LLLAGSVGTFFFWARASSPTHLLYYALYIWTALCGMTVVTQFWTTMARIFTLGEAKRLFATIAIGSVAGSVLGAGLARVFFLFTGARALVLLASAGFAASAVLAVLLRPSSPSRGAAQGRAAKELREELATTSLVGKNPYLLTIGSLALAMAITATVVDYSFKRALVRHFAPEEIGPIVSSVTFASYALGGIVQIFFVARILAAVGTARSLRLLPAVLAVGAVAGVAMPYTFVAIGLRTIDGAFRYTLQRTATELLYVPVSEAIRGRVKTLIDVVTQRAGQAIASLALLAVPAAMHTRYLVLAVAVCSTVWFWLAVRVRPRYLALFRAMIQEGVPQVFDAMPALDQSGVEALVAALSDERDEQVLFALDVLASRGIRARASCCAPSRFSRRRRDETRRGWRGGSCRTMIPRFAPRPFTRSRRSTST
jgi:AAA family ATP:ADP antiporter